MQRKDYIRNLKRDFLIIIGSIVAAILLVRVGVLEDFLLATQGIRAIGSFIAGVFFTSGFTIALASIALAEIAKTTPALIVAFYGALGAMVGDLVIFLFLRDAFAKDLSGFFKTSAFKKTIAFFHLGLIRWLSPLLGALIIASPLPDELGLTLLGLAQVRTVYLIPIAFAMNFFGILLVVYAARALQ